MAQLPNSDLWLFSIKSSKENFELKNPLNINNREGYDNQPSFSLDSKKINYVSVREDQQADIYVYTIKKKKTIAFTKTPISEYSPVTTKDEKLIATVPGIGKKLANRIVNELEGVHDKISNELVFFRSFKNSAKNASRRNFR
jgi:Tol biopolymer transport system component